MRKFIFILTIFLIGVLCVRAVFGVEQPLKTMDIVGYLSEMPAIESTIQDTIEALQGVNNWFKKNQDKLEINIDKSENIFVDGLNYIGIALNTLLQIVFFVFTLGKAVLPMLLAIVMDLLYILKVVYYIIYGIPI